MTQHQISKLDKALARVCETCPVCRTARNNQTGIAYQLVSRIENGICPFCSAYERVHGKKAHVPT